MVLNARAHTTRVLQDAARALSDIPVGQRSLECVSIPPVRASCELDATVKWLSADEFILSVNFTG